jgi:hypothetical protein
MSRFLIILILLTSTLFPTLARAEWLFSPDFKVDLSAQGYNGPGTSPTDYPVGTPLIITWRVLNGRGIDVVPSDSVNCSFSGFNGSGTQGSTQITLTAQTTILMYCTNGFTSSSNQIIIPVYNFLPPTPITATATCNGTAPQINLSWPATTDTSLYWIDIAGRSIGNTVTTSFNDANVITGQSYQYRVRSQDSRGRNSNGSTLSNSVVALNCNPPDLVVSSINTVPGLVKVGNDVRFSAFITNTSAGTNATGARASVARFCIDNPSCQTSAGSSFSDQVNVPAIAPTVSQQVNTTRLWRPTTDQHTLTVCADVTNTSGETNKTNSCQTYPILVEPTPAFIRSEGDVHSNDEIIQTQP